jgi:hypothetical protein
VETEDKEETLSARWIDKLGIYQAAMAHEQSIRSSYQSLFITVESIIITVFLVIVGTGWLGRYLLAFFPALGILFCFIAVASDYRATNADHWRRKIIDLVEKTDMKEDFKRGRYGDPKRQHPYFSSKSKTGKSGRRIDSLFGHTIERVVAPVILVIWAIIMSLIFTGIIIP